VGNLSASPDGHWVAFDAYVGRSQLFLLDRRNGSVSNITPDSMLYVDPNWSPTGEEIVCLAGSPSAFGIFRVSRTGLPIKQVTASSGLDREPVWSPGGDRITWRNAGPASRVWGADTSGADAKPIVFAKSGPSWASDGNSIAICAPTRTGRKVFLFDIPTRRGRQITF
jgi:TolB protein